jgi:hypothetical protein
MLAVITNIDLEKSSAGSTVALNMSANRRDEKSNGPRNGKPKDMISAERKNKIRSKTPIDLRCLRLVSGARVYDIGSRLRVD